MVIFALWILQLLTFWPACIPLKKSMGVNSDNYCIFENVCYIVTYVRNHFSWSKKLSVWAGDHWVDQKRFFHKVGPLQPFVPNLLREISGGRSRYAGSNRVNHFQRTEVPPQMVLQYVPSLTAAIATFWLKGKLRVIFLFPWELVNYFS